MAICLEETLSFCDGIDCNVPQMYGTYYNDSDLDSEHYYLGSIGLFIYLTNFKTLNNIIKLKNHNKKK